MIMFNPEWVYTVFSLTRLILATHVILLYEAGSINVPTFQMKK